MRKIYLDTAATTQMDPRVLKAMLPFLKGDFGNPSSAHAFGQKAKAAVEEARTKVAGFLSCLPEEVVFTSGATEANNLAIQGVVSGKKKPHVVISEIEHESVLAPVQALERQGIVEVTYVPVSLEGLIAPEDAVKAVKPNTVLVSVMYANSEIGTIQPVQEIARQVKEKNKHALFHTDAVQAVGYLSSSVKELAVDLLTISSHKLYGPKGAGALYVKKGTQISPLVWGGGQEEGARSGTENVLGIVGFAKAAELLKDPKLKLHAIVTRQLRDRLIQLLLRIPKTRLAGSLDHRLPNNVYVLFEGIEGKDLVMLLDRKGIAVSAGSACSERSAEPSHVLRALGYKESAALSGVRFSLGRKTTKEEIEKTARQTAAAVEFLRQGLV